MAPLKKNHQNQLPTIIAFFIALSLKTVSESLQTCKNRKGQT